MIVEQILRAYANACRQSPAEPKRLYLGTHMFDQLRAAVNSVVRVTQPSGELEPSTYMGMTIYVVYDDPDHLHVC